MQKRDQRIALITGLVLLCGLGAWFVYSPNQPHPDQAGTNGETEPANKGKDEAHRTTATKFKGMDIRQDPSFPINDKIELPFLGAVRCHAREENVQFTANGKQMEWPFKLYYLPNGMFVRAEFVKPGEKDYEHDAKFLTELYDSRGQSYVGFPDKPAPASLSKVLQRLYENEPFDRATKINITWVLRQGTEGRILPWYVANVFGVSPGLMRVPDEIDEAFLKYRVLFTPEAVAVFTDNAL